MGIGKPLKIIAAAACGPTTLEPLAGTRTVPSDFHDLAPVFRNTHRQILWRVVLPASVPQLFTWLRFGLTKAGPALVAVKRLASSEGPGDPLVQGRQMFRLDLVLAGRTASATVANAMNATRRTPGPASDPSDASTRALLDARLGQTGPGQTRPGQTWRARQASHEQRSAS